MRLKMLLGSVLFALVLSSCSTVQKVVYRIDVPQGNYLEASTVEQVKPGMTQQQVQYLLGSPVLVDPYNQGTWYYVFLQQRAYQAAEQHTLIVKFNQNHIVVEALLDRPLPQVTHQDENNTILNAPESSGKRWWQFW